MITQTIDLCMIPGSTNPVIHVNQYDAYPGGLIFNLYEESAFEIPAGAAVTINGTKPDKHGFSYTASYSGNVVTAALEQQMTAVAGNVECELRVSLGSEIIGTQNFTLCVEEAALNNETIISDSDMPAIANAQRYASEAAASAAEAASTLESALKKTDLVNSATQTVAGEKALDAAYGKTLADSKANIDGSNITSISSWLDTLGVTGLATGDIETPTNVSVNNITEPGYYYLLNSNGVTDMPEGINGNLWVFHASGTHNVIQIFRRLGTAESNDQNIYIRRGEVSGVTTSWWKYGDSTQFVAKTGDTMTGNLTVSDGGHVYVKGTDAGVNTTPTSNYWGNGLILQDSVGANFGQVRSFHLTNGTRGIYIEAQPGAQNYIQIGAIGTTPFVYLNQPAAWRDALGVLPYNNNVSTSGVGCSGYLTSSRKQIAFMVPYPLFSGTDFTISSLKLVVRHVVGTTYAYVRSGTNGATYTQLGSGATSVIANGEAVRSNEIASTKVWVHPGSGIEIGITFNYAVCSDNSGTELPNNTPLTVAATLTGTIS